MRTQRRTLAALLTTVLLLAMAPGGAADDTAGTLEPRSAPLGSDFYIGGPTTAVSDSDPAVAWNNVGREYLVVWRSGSDFPTRDMEIRGRRVSEAGAPLGSDFVVSGPLAVVNNGAPGLAWNETTGEYLVVWSDDRHEIERGSDIYGQRLSPVGDRLGGNFRISSSAAAEELVPAVAWNAKANQYLVVWEDWRNLYTTGQDIYGQRLSAGGERLGGNFRISSALAASTEASPAVVWNFHANEYLVVWTDLRDRAARGSDIYGQRVASTGKRLGGNFRISGAAALGMEASPQAAYDRDGNAFLVVWMDSRLGGVAAPDIYGRRVAADGKRVGADFRISGLSRPVDAYSPAAAWNAKTGEYLVVWRDRRGGDASGYDVYGREVPGRGTPSEPDFRISGSGATSDEICPALGYNLHLNQYLVVWQDRRDTTRSYDIWGRRVTG